MPTRCHAAGPVSATRAPMLPARVPGPRANRWTTGQIVEGGGTEQLHPPSFPLTRTEVQNRLPKKGKYPQEYRAEQMCNIGWGY